MRVVSGLYRGRTLAEFKGKDVRPTSDMARESLFNILRDRIEGAKFLDLFAGTGAVGIEALSRGAREVLFNDNSRESMEIVKKNLAKLGIERGAATSVKDAICCLSSATGYDIIYIDPPYKSDLGARALSVACNALADGGIAIFESDAACGREFKGLKKYDERKYGRVRLTFFAKENEK